MEPSTRATLRIVVVGALVVFGARALMRRANPVAVRPAAPAAATDSAGKPAAPKLVVTPVHPPADYTPWDNAAAAQRSADDTAFARARGEGLTTRQTYIAPLNPEPPRRQ